MKLFSRDNEQTIVRKLNRGDATAIDLLYAEYAPLLTAVCARYVAQNEDIKDILQEAFIKMFDKGRTFNYRGKGSLKAWATRIVINESLLFLRQQAKQEQCFLDKEPPDVVDEEPEIGSLSAEEITAMIRQLPSGYRTVFNLFVIEGLSHQQIAAQLNIKADTSASQLYKAKVMLARMIKSYQKQDRMTESTSGLTT